MNQDSSSQNYLATAFRDVDRAEDAARCSGCLDFIGQIPVFRNVKEESFQIIAQTNPTWVLDAGCGSGTDLVSLAAILPGSCNLVGMDSSAFLLRLAAERTRNVPRKGLLIQGDLLKIPFRNNRFHACRIDRVFQHLENPGLAGQEIFRVTAPGGICTVFDNDWGTFTIALDDTDMASRISTFWCNSFASGHIGRDLPEILRECGFENIRIIQKMIHLADFAVAARVFDLENLLNRMVLAEIICPAERDEIVRELDCRSGCGRFMTGYTGYLVCGMKPERNG